MAITFGIATTCDVEMPNIMMLVQVSGRGALGTQASTEFIVPLYSDCIYEKAADPVKAGKGSELNDCSSPTEVILGDSIPKTAVSADFPSAYSFVGSDGLLLDSNAQNEFLESLSSKVLTPVDAGTAMSLVICTVTGSDGTSISFDFTQAPVFAGGAPINVASYHCEVVIEAGEGY
jgi:hypothetical protein